MAKATKQPGLNYYNRLYELLKKQMGSDKMVSFADFSAMIKTARSHSGGKTKAEKMKAETDALVAFERQFAEDGAGPNYNGLMVAFYLQADAAAQLAIPDGEEIDELHLTLCYLGDAGQYSSLTKAEIIVAMRDVARWQQPLMGTVSGIGRFIGSNSSGGLDVIYASVDMPGLNEFRADVARRLGGNYLSSTPQHGFQPHITLAYVAGDEPTPDYDLSGINLRFECLYVCIGDEAIELPMMGPAAYSEVDATSHDVIELCGDGGDCRLFLEQEFAEPPDWLNYLPVPGVYTSPKYGQMTITRERNERFVENFAAGVYQKQLPIDCEHDLAASGAVGWITMMRVNDDGSVDARSEWNDRGQALIGGDRFKYFSPAYYDKWTDPVTTDAVQDVAIGGAITTRPFFKEKSLRPLVSSDHGTSLRIGERAVPAEGGKGFAEVEFSSLTRSGQTNNEGVNPMGNDTDAVKLTELTTRVELAEANLATEKARAEAAEAKLATETAAKTQAEGVVTKLHERVGELEKSGRQLRFAETAKGWIGDKAGHVNMLEFLFEHSEGKGEESDQFKAYVEAQKAAMAQTRSAGLFKENGITTQDTGAESAVELVEQRARKLIEADAKLGYDDAVTRVLSEDGALWSQYRSETAVRI